jgi:hypothetical protein
MDRLARNRVRDVVASTLEDWHRARDGAVVFLCLAAVLILFMLSLVVFDALEVSNEKTHVQTSADAAAYTQATVQARTMNMMAFTNVAKRLNVGIVSSYVATFRWMRWLRNALAIGTGVCWAAAVFSVGGIAKLCTRMTKWTIGIACAVFRENQDFGMGGLDRAIRTTIGPELQALDNYQRYYAELTPFWGFAASAMQGLQNRAPVTVSWPPPSKEARAPARLPIDRYDVPFRSNDTITNLDRSQSYGGMCKRGFEGARDHEMLFVDFLIKNGLEAASNASSTSKRRRRRKSGRSRRAPDGRSVGPASRNRSRSRSDRSKQKPKSPSQRRASPRQCRQAKRQARRQLERNDQDYHYDCGDDDENKCGGTTGDECEEDDPREDCEMVFGGENGPTTRIGPNYDCNVEQGGSGTDFKCGSKEMRVAAMVATGIAGVGAHFGPSERSGGVWRFLSTFTPPNWRDACAGTDHGTDVPSLLGKHGYRGAGVPMRVMSPRGRRYRQKWWYATSNLVMAYRPHAGRNDTRRGDRAKFEFLSDDWTGSSDAFAASGVWALSRSEIAFQAETDPHLWASRWAARIRPVALHGEWPYGPRSNLDLQTAFRESRDLLAKQWAVAELLDASGQWDLITRPYHEQFGWGSTSGAAARLDGLVGEALSTELGLGGFEGRMQGLPQ